MKDAIGSYLNLTLLFIFILIVSGFISLAINYTRAYRVKNVVLMYLEKYEGNADNTEMLERFDAYKQSVGYKIGKSAIERASNLGYTCPTYNGEYSGWCYKSNKAGTKYGDSFNMEIVVFINLNIPIINKVFSDVEFFWMKATTNAIPVLEK